jgi:hypothetical protein
MRMSEIIKRMRKRIGRLFGYGTVDIESEGARMQ